MNSYPKLNFPPIKLRARDSRGRTVVFDRVRSLYVVLTPEEWVRRHVVEFLVGRCGAPLRSIVEEYAVNVNAAPQRADVVVMDGAARPVALVECKAPDVRITSEVFEQATRYNAVLGARYVILCRTGMNRRMCDMRSVRSQSPSPLRNIPSQIWAAGWRRSIYSRKASR